MHQVLLLPPLRAHHCKVCDRCVATFDHHCFFINTCVGERNHCRFLLYCFFQACATWVAISVVNSGHVPAKHIPKASTWLEKNGMVVVSSLYVWPLALFSTVMFMVHLGLAVSNTTTFEVSGGSDKVDYLSGTKECDLPFSKVRGNQGRTNILGGGSKGSPRLTLVFFFCMYSTPATHIVSPVPDLWDSPISGLSPIVSALFFNGGTGQSYVQYYPYRVPI